MAIVKVEQKYKENDWIKLKDVSTIEAAYTGKIVRIGGISVASEIFNCTVPGNDRTSTVYPFNVIERMATEQEIKRAETKIQKAKEKKEVLLKEEREGLTYKIEEIGALATDIFGEERVKFEGKDVIIYFPELELTNSKDGKHKIKDLYIKFTVDVNVFNDSWQIGNYKADVAIHGLRGSLSLKEYQSQYGHSHMSRGNMQWANFCTGTSEYKMLIDNVCMSLKEEDWIMLFLSLENYLVWESLEGGPYCKMEDMKYTKRISDTSVTEELNRIMSDMPKNVWDVNEGGLSLINGHPLLGEYFNSTSQIRDASSYSKEEAEKAVKEGIEYAISQRKRNKAEISWGKEKRELSIYYEEPVDDGVKPVSKGIIDQYCNILTEKGKKFIKKYTHGRAKQNNYQKVFGEGGTH